MLENLLLIVFGTILSLTYRGLTFSSTSHVFIALFVLLHIVGAHYTYAQMPLGLWAKDYFSLPATITIELRTVRSCLLLASRVSEARRFNRQRSRDMAMVGEICNREVVVTTRDATVADAAKLMRDHHVGTLVVAAPSDAAQRPVGIVTDRDLVVEIMAMDYRPA